MCGVVTEEQSGETVRKAPAWAFSEAVHTPVTIRGGIKRTCFGLRSVGAFLVWHEHGY